VLLSATTGAAALRLSSNTSTTHTLFHIPSRGYLTPLPEPSTVLERLHSADVIVIDEMSMMISYMLCTVEHRLKQTCKDTISNTFYNKLVLLVGDLAQLPAICVHSPKVPDIICRCCHISSAPCWATALQHKLEISVSQS
jgi:ATP-dependent exoDNAse (exonuclease V) alpha subunit